MRLRYRPPYLSLQSPPGAMFSIALLNIQVQSQSRVKGARKKIAKHKYAMQAPQKPWDNPCLFGTNCNSFVYAAGELNVHAPA